MAVAKSDNKRTLIIEQQPSLKIQINIFRANIVYGFDKFET